MDIEMTQNSAKINEKIGKVLQTFLEPNFQVKNDVYLNLFLTRLVGKEDNDKPSLIQTNKQLSGQLCQWIIQASDLWGKGKVNPPTIILSFALNLTSQLSCDEHIFVDLNCQNVFESLVGIAQKNSSNDQNVTHAMVTLLCSFLDHKSGVQWVMATTHWTHVINLGLKGQTICIKKKAYQFVTKLLENTIGFNRNFGFNLVGKLLKPIKDIFRSLPSLKSGQELQIKNAELFGSLKPTLEFISEVASTLLKSFATNVLQLFLEQHTEEMIDQILPLPQSEDLSYRLLKVKFVFLFYKLGLKLQGVKAVAHDSLTLYDITTMMDLIKDEMDKNYVRCVIKICDYAHRLYCSMSPRLPLCIKKGEAIEFQNQMVIFQLMPTMVFSIQIYSGKLKYPADLLIKDDFRREFVKKLGKIASIKCLELCIKWLKNLEIKQDLMEDVTFSLEYVAKTKTLLNKERAATVFPVLVYSLKDTLTVLNLLVNIDWTPRAVKFLSTLVDTIVDFVESFDLTWKDTIETIRVMDLACDFLHYPDWDDKIIIIKGLKLLNTAISKYMCPDMVLLIYSTKDSPVSQAGSLLYDKCHDSCWEIRDSALEVIYTLALNANIRFPALSSVLLDAALPQLIINIALNDDEYCARATAFRCLQELVQIQDIWDVLLGVEMFLDNVLAVFEHEAEGMVRKEAAMMLYKIYKHQDFPDEILPRLYDVMTHAATEDLYWEVKYNALDFWFQSWGTHLSEQGMIDQSFPSHTFSKEFKKIVALNDAEVRKRIIKVLNQLSHIGCLYVMKSAVEDYCDIEVSKKAADITFRIIGMFRRYQVPRENVDLSEPPGVPNYLLHRQILEPVSPASSTTMTAPSPADIGNLRSPECPNFPYVDPLSPFPAPFSLFPDFEQLTPTDSTHSMSSQDRQSQSNETQHATFVHLNKPVPTTPNPNTEQDPLFYNTTADEDPLSINPVSMFDVDMLGSGDDSFISTKVEDIVNSNRVGLVKREKVLDESIHKNEMTIFQEMYNPIDQVPNITRMKTKTYLAPSEYLKFVYDEVEPYAMKKAELPDGLGEFDSLVDDILKEYNMAEDVNSPLLGT